MSGVIQELKRRNVFKVGTAYVFLAWLLAQVADVFLDPLGVPEWFIQSMLILLLIGFPVVIILAWAYELTPEGIKKEKDVDRSQSITHQTGRKLDFTIIAFLVVALVYFTYDKFVLDPARDAARESSLVAAAEQQLGERGRVLLRPSGTEPVVRVMIEGEDAIEVKQLCERLAADVERILD